MVLKKINPLSLGKILAAIYAALGLLLGGLFSVISLIAPAVANSPEQGAGLAALFGVGSIILFPLFYGVLGLVSGVISAFVYNLAAKYLGGIEVSLEAKSPSTPTA